MNRPVTCHAFRAMCDEYTHEELDASLRRQMERHEAECLACAESAQAMRHQRRALRDMSSRRVPMQLAVQLRVVASRERARRVSRMDWPARVAAWRQQARMWTNNLWKPLAIPAAGGLASALLLFSALMPTFHLNGGTVADVPTAWYQSAELNGLSPFGADVDDVTLDVRVDTSGRVIDYEVPADDDGLWRKDPEMRRAVENSLLFLSFQPARFFGQPASDRIRITLRRSRIEVRG